MVKTQNAISAMYLRKSNSYTENTVYPGLREIDIKRGMLKKAKDLIRSIRSNHPWLKLNKEEFFRAAGLIRYDSTIGKSGYTLAALMLVGTDEAISSYLPYYKIEAIVRKQDLMRYDDRLTVTCNLIDGYELLNGFIEKHLPDKFYLDGKTRLSLRDKIFREVIANMLIHREYMNPIPITLVIYKDKLVTNNANKPFAYEKLASQLCSYPKNPHIATMFAQMGFAEYLGMGSRSFNIGTLRQLCGLVDMDSVDDMCDEIRMMMVNRGPVSIIGSGGNINKLYRLVPKKVWLDNRLSLVQLDRL